MKISRLTLLPGALALVVGVLTEPAFSQANIIDTKHNLSSTAGADQIVDKSTDEDQICVFCHTPHQASPSAPLWNHTQSTTMSYGVYGSSTLDASDIADIGGGTDVSNLCMSCHDGTVGVNDLGNPANDTGGNPTMGTGNELDATGKILGTRSANLSTDLSNDHPVNFTYDAALATADGELQTPDSVDFVDAAKTVPLFSAKVQCASCHDPHDNTNPPFLVRSNVGSGLCLTCHAK
ncbi:MAG: cytochrome c3 family protein [Acidobacteriota bacterium]